MFKIVKSARIDVIKPSELNVGDFVLLRNCKREIIMINELNGYIVVSNPISNKEQSLKMFLNYYRIVDCEEIEILEE